MAQLCAVVWTLSFRFLLLQIIGQCVYGHIALMMEVCVSVQTQPTNFFCSHNVLVFFVFVVVVFWGWGVGGGSSSLHFCAGLYLFQNAQCFTNCWF